MRSNSDRKTQQQPAAAPFRPDNIFTQSYDTVIAICRELSYPQLWTWSGKFTRYFTPPPLGRCLLLLTYWAVILTMLWSNTILTPSSQEYGYRWEKVGFRAAWVSVTQLPLIYILSGKANLITILTGISYERLNWLHRWVARTMFLTVIVHWSFFFTEWSIADFVSLEMAMMPMVKYGFGAWATLGWMVITGFGFFRSASYELWFLQHLAAAMVLLWLVHTHVPSYATYNVWFAVGVVVFDRLVRTMRSVVINLHLLSIKQRTTSQERRIGYDAEVKSFSPDFLHVRIRNVGFSWKPGQHVYLSIPRVGILEAHPFTIANVPKSILGEDGADDIELCVRVHNGFTKRLHRRHQAQQTPKAFLSFISGPWGVPPAIDRFESLILMATGNGSSFTMPIFQQTLLTNNHVRSIRYVWIIRQAGQLDWFRDQLLSAWTRARRRDIKIFIQVFITGSVDSSSTSSNEDQALTDETPDSKTSQESSLPVEKETETLGRAPHSLDPSIEKGQITTLSGVSAPQSSTESSSLNEQPTIDIGHGRPELDRLIRPVVEEACGETGILACGGSRFTGQLRNYVAHLSDERAVHKGTGAQGIYLFCETYGW